MLTVLQSPPLHSTIVFCWKEDGHQHCLNRLGMNFSFLRPFGGNPQKHGRFMSSHSRGQRREATIGILMVHSSTGAWLTCSKFDRLVSWRTISGFFGHGSLVSMAPFEVEAPKTGGSFTSSRVLGVLGVLGVGFSLPEGHRSSAPGGEPDEAEVPVPTAQEQGTSKGRARRHILPVHLSISCFLEGSLPFDRGF